MRSILGPRMVYNDITVPMVVTAPLGVKLAIAILADANQTNISTIVGAILKANVHHVPTQSLTTQYGRQAPQVDILPLDVNGYVMQTTN